MTDFSIKLRDFESQILYFNGMYKLPVAPYPTVFKVVENEKEKHKTRTVINLGVLDPKDYLIGRIHDFMSILQKEVIEGDDIIQKLKLGVHQVKDKQGVEHTVEYTELDCLTDLADWFGDAQVYCASEMAKYGIPLKETLRIIMSSNFSKLGADGKPIYDAEGKVEKGPMYWKPEPELKAMLAEKIEEAIAANKNPATDGIVWGNGGK